MMARKQNGLEDCNTNGGISCCSGASSRRQLSGCIACSYPLCTESLVTHQNLRSKGKLSQDQPPPREIGRGVGDDLLATLPRPPFCSWYRRLTRHPTWIPVSCSSSLCPRGLSRSMQGCQASRQSHSPASTNVNYIANIVKLHFLLMS